MPMKRTGTPSLSAIASRIPPLALPSSFVTVIPVSPSASCEFHSLHHRVLPEAGVKHQHNFLRGSRIVPRYNALDLGEFIHEALLILQATGGVGEQHVNIPGTGSLPGVKHNSCGICTRLLRYDVDVISLTPYLQVARRLQRGTCLPLPASRSNPDL